jgi:hypothetical protein
MRSQQMLLTILILTAGYSAETEPEFDAPYNPTKARAALVASLDAWRKGEASALARRDTPIRFVDDDFVAGLRLSDYEIEEPDAPVGLHQDVHVMLSLRDARGRVVEHEAQYQVATEPAVAVLRSDR